MIQLILLSTPYIRFLIDQSHAYLNPNLMSEFLLLSRTRLISDSSSDESLSSLLEEYTTPAIDNPFFELTEVDELFDVMDSVEFNAAIIDVKKSWCLL